MKKTTLLLACAFLLLVQSCSKKENLQGHNPIQPSLDGNKHINWIPGDVVITGNYKFINSGTYKSMEISGQSLVDGVQAQQWTYNDQTSQQWTVTSLGSGYFKIININSGKALAPPAGDNAQGTILRQYTYDGTDRMIWSITFVGGTGLYKFINKGNGLVATLEGSGTTDGTVITQRTYDTAAGFGNTKQWWGVQQTVGTAYYVSNSGGNDANTGLSTTAPFKTLAMISGRTFFPGDWILLKSGDTWTSQTLTLKGQGKATKAILLVPYGTGAKPAIQPSITDEACIKLVGNSGWRILNMDLSKAEDGIRATYDQVYNSDYLSIESCTIHDMDDTYNSNPTRFNHFSNGVNIEGYAPTGTGRLIVLNHFNMQSCTFTNCNQAFWGVGTPFSRCNIFGFSNGDLVQMDNFTVSDCTATNGKQWGASFVSCAYGTVTNFDTNTIGLGGTNNYGVAAFVCSASHNVTFDGCDMTNTYRGTLTTDGDGFDFEGGNSPDGLKQHDITLKNCAINYTEGAGVTVFDDGGTTQNCLIDHVTINRFGESSGAPSQGIFFQGGTGTVSNCNLHRDNTYNYFQGATGTPGYSGFTFINNVTN